MRFIKMQAAGNDFIVMGPVTAGKDWGKLAQRWCDRHFGIGADGLILVSAESSTSVGMRIFNPDGSEAESCGNGLRCTARYAYENGLVKRKTFTVNTLAGETSVKLVEPEEAGRPVERVTVTMTRPVFDAAEIPVKIKATQKTPVLDYPLEIKGKKLPLSFISMGNPHAITFIEGPVDRFALEAIGPLVEHNVMFPKRTNFEVVQVVNRHTIRARVWERGAGETLACGTGACAIAVAARLKGLINTTVDIILPGGTLTIDWTEGERVKMTGPVAEVFKGEITP